MNCACIGLAGSLTLEWDPSPDPDVVAYQLYYGSDSGQYTNVVFAGPITTVTIDNLAGGVTYYFTATSLNSSGLESDFAPELSYTMPAPSSLPAPSCFIVLSNMDQIYDGTAKTVSAFSLPGDFGFVLTYDGAPDPPVDAGSYWVAATSTDPTCPTTTTGLLTIEKAPASIQINNLDQAYNGSAKSVSITTSPPGLNFAVTYNGMLPVPAEAGIYGVSVWIIDNNYSGSATATLVIEKATANISLQDLDQTYTGSKEQVWAMTDPPGLALSLTYNGAPDWPVNAGSYTVEAVVDDPDFNGSTTATMVIHKAELPIFVENLNQVFDGSPKMVSVNTTVPNIAVSTTYNGFPYAPVSAGSYFVESTIIGDDNYTGSVTNIFYIAKAQATIQFLDLAQTADGTPKAVTTTTQPPGLNVQVSYDGQNQAPSAAGTYAALATIDDMNYQGSALATLTILPGTSASRNPSQPDVTLIAASPLPPTARTQRISIYWPHGFSGVVLWSSTNLVDWTKLTNAAAATHSIALPLGTIPTFYRATANDVGGVSSPPLSISKF